jgi:hypothetical protein
MVTLTECAKARLLDAGLDNTALVRSSAEDQPFGNADVVFGLGELLLRFVRDRGQTFVDIASSAAPTEFHQFDDIEIAMGWKTIDQILAKREPDDLGIVLTRVRENLGTLTDAFSGDRERFTRARVKAAARERGKAFTARLRGEK